VLCRNGLHWSIYLIGIHCDSISPNVQRLNVLVLGRTKKFRHLGTISATINVPIFNVIVDGSSPFTRSLTTADSKCQPLFILRTGRELGRMGLVGGSFFYCQQLTANAYPRLRFGTISGPGAVFLAPDSAPVIVQLRTKNNG
jgi:hypothetical protein